MRKKLLFSIAFIMSSLSFCYATEIVKNERIQKVIVFRNGAQIESKISQLLDKGEYTIVVDELPNSLMENTLQVSSEGDFAILSVECKSGIYTNNKKNKLYSSIEDSIEYYQSQIDLDNIRKYSIDQEENLLIVNKNLSSKQGAQVVDIEDMAELYRRRLPELKKESLRLQKIITQNTERLNAFKQQLNERLAGKNNKQVWINLNVIQPQNIKLTLKYLVNDASWTPIYDIRSTDIGEPIQFVLKANVQQSTGVNWKDVELSLSTGNPANFSNKPELYDWRLFMTDIVKPKVMEYGMGAADEMRMNLPKIAMIQDVGPMAITNEQAVTVEYQIMKAFSINSDGDFKTVEIQTNSSNANYRYLSIPKLDSKAYLIASIKDWDQHLLLAAEANIYLKGDYVTKTYLDPMNIDDSLEITLGSDDGIKVERKMIKDISSKKTLGSTKKIVQGYDISVRNSKKKMIHIDVQDQIPLAGDSGIEIKYVAEGAAYNPENGKLSWTHNIAPGETKKMSFQIEVKHPKNKVLQGW